MENYTFPSDGNNWDPLPAVSRELPGGDESTREPLFPSEIATYDSGQPSIHYAVSVPDNYTPGYDYPLIVWFHDDGLNEQDVTRWLPRFSPQNYVGIGLRATIPDAGGLPGAFRWSGGPEHTEWLEHDLAAVLGEACARLSVHTGRIVTAGIGGGATVALQMMLRRPEWFAAAVALNAAWPDHWRFGGWGQFAGRSVWLGDSPMVRRPAGRSARLLARTLYATGINVTHRRYPPDQWPLETFTHEADDWLIRTLCPDTVIA